MIECTNNDRVFHIELNAPPVNVLDGAMLNAIADILEGLESERQVNAVLISGKGRCFSAGASVAEHRRDLAPDMISALRRACVSLASFPAPTGALVHGACLGGAMEVVSFCDFVIADPEATLGQPEIKLSFFPPMAAVQLARITGFQNAAYTVFTGANLSADKAESMGLVQRVLERDQWGEIDDLFNGLSGAALRLAKKALTAGVGDDLTARMDAVDRLFLEDLYEIDDVKEGIASFSERRKPRWSHT